MVITEDYMTIQDMSTFDKMHISSRLFKHLSLINEFNFRISNIIVDEASFGSGAFKMHYNYTHDYLFKLGITHHYGTR